MGLSTRLQWEFSCTFRGCIYIGAFIGDVIGALESKNSKLITTLKVLEFQEFQTFEKVDVQMNVCDAFE